MHIRTTSGISFEQKPGESLLKASIRQAAPIRHSCSAGRCGFCRVHVAEGETNAFRQEQALNDQEKQDGWVLACCRTAVNDIVLDGGEVARSDKPSIMRLPCTLSGLEPLATNMVKVTLRLPLVVEFQFLPGQFLELISPTGIKRSYSIASTDVREHQIELHIELRPGGAMSDYLKHAKVGEVLHLVGPKGDFYLRDTTGKDLIFLANNTGMGPIKAMLGCLADRPAQMQPASVRLVWCTPQERDAYLQPEDLPEGIDISYITSSRGFSWSQLRQAVSRIENTQVYAAGSMSMITRAKITLSELGLADDQFISEPFLTATS